ncbi:MAG TPA: serine hydrolase [Cyclobacteriaceae bacterium]|jgi:CubicO group peptidase (beta-lactamase class C family)|nr:serine hydrolase [Cyclobacteriaceae bacterium]
MKKILLLLPVVMLQFCTPRSENTDGKIKSVETRLAGPVYFEGDSTWTIEQRMKHYHVPGVSLAVIENYKVVWKKAYGVMDEETKEPVTTSTLFQAGSISKPVAAFTALKLVEEGKISLDTNVNRFLKSWQLPDNEFTQKKKVALKHLLSHTGGVTVHGFLGYSPDLPVPTLLQVLNGEKPANSPPIRVDKLPDESFRYSGGGYTIMQQMLIDVEGKDFPSITNEKVLQPLHMVHSTYSQPLPPDQLKLAATGYLPDGSMTKGKRHTYPEMAAAGLWTTAEDLALFAVDIQNALKGDKSEVLSNDMVKKMVTPYYKDFIGLGLFLSDFGGEKYFSHNGWDEGFCASLMAHQSNGHGVVVMINANQPEFMNEVTRAVALAYGWKNYVRRYAKMKIDTSKFASIRGRYKNGNDGLLSVYSKGGKLFRKYIRGNETELLQVSDSTYASTESDQLVQFKMNPADGKRNVLLLGGNSEVKFEHPLLKDEEKIPYEHLLAGNFDKALAGYQQLLKADAKDGAVNEENINGWGYNMLQSGNIKLAKDVFKVNMMLYPKSANAYDSYAEACMKNGDKELAITNYKKSLQLNPKNENAVKMLEELKKK